MHRHHRRNGCFHNDLDKACPVPDAGTVHAKSCTCVLVTLSIALHSHAQVPHVMNTEDRRALPQNVDVG